MEDDKLQLMETLREARERLHSAMHQLNAMTVLNPEALALTRHALTDYLHINAGVLDLLLTDAPATTDAKTLDDLHALRHLTDLMAHTVKRLGLLRPLQREHLHWNPVDLHQMLQRAERYYASPLQRKHLALHVEHTEQAPYVWADRVAVAVVLGNLLSNAITYSPPQRHIWVRLEWDTESVTCLVRDQGPGLSDEEQAQLFRRGVMLSSTPTHGEAQHGYGLAIARELTELLGGTIWCDSTPGAGATFAFRLPLAPDTSEDVPWLTAPPG